MKSLLTKESTGLDISRRKSKRRHHSDTVGCHLEDRGESEHLEAQQTAQTRQTKKRLKFNKREKFSYFATLNINSLMKTGKLKHLTDVLDQHKILITALQELRNTDQDPLESGGYRLYKGPPGPRVMRNVPQFGVGFMVHNSIMDSIEDFSATSPRTATLTIKVENKTYTLINVHAPTNDKNSKDRIQVDKFWEELDQMISNIPDTHIKILLGDFNAKVGQERRYRRVVGKWPAHKLTNKNGQRLIELCTDHGLILETTRFKRRPHKLMTWKCPNITLGEFQIDHVAMDKNYHKEIYNVKVLRGVDVDSDHYISKIKIKITPRKKHKPSQSRRRRKYDPSYVINNKEYLERSKTHPSDELGTMINKLKAIAEELAPIRKRKKHAWWNEDCDKAIEKRHRAWLNDQQKKTEKSREELIHARRQAAKEIRRIKRNHQEETLKSIDEAFSQHKTRDYYKTFRQYQSKYTPPTLMMKDKNGKMAHNNRDNAEILAEYFKKLLNGEEPKEYLEYEPNPQNKTPLEKVTPPDYNEVIKAIESLKNYKAGGENQLVAELWKNANEQTLRNLHKCIIDIWNTEKMPEEWNTAIIHPLHKKGDRSDPNNYRGISLLDTTYKIFSKIIYSRIQEQLDRELGEYQGGFRPGRSCPDQILSLKWIMKHQRSRSKNLVITFVDFKKAYDSIHRESLLKILQEFGLHQKLINLISITLKNTKSKVKFRDEVSEPFEIRTGLRQGDGLSPLLFNCVLEKVMREWYKKCQPNIKIGRNIRLNCLAFADDLALLANNMEEAKRQIEELEIIAAKVGLQISFEKTEMMPTFKTEETVAQMKNNKQIKIVKKFKYLGEIITWNSNEKASIESRTTKLRQAQRITWPTYKKKSLSMNAKLKHYYSVVKPEATYASETLFKLNAKSTTDKLQKADRRIIRTIIQKKHQVDGQWRLLPNEVVYQKSESIVDTMRKRRIALFSHIARLTEARLLKQLFDYFWKNKTKNNWFNEVQDDLEELNITIQQIKNREEKKILKDRDIRLKLKTFARRQYTITDEQRAARSERMKRFWENKRKLKAKSQVTRKT